MFISRNRLRKKLKEVKKKIFIKKLNISAETDINRYTDNRYDTDINIVSVIGKNDRYFYRYVKNLFI